MQPFELSNRHTPTLHTTKSACINVREPLTRFEAAATSSVGPDVQEQLLPLFTLPYCTSSRRHSYVVRCALGMN